MKVNHWTGNRNLKFLSPFLYNYIYLFLSFFSYLFIYSFIYFCIPVFIYLYSYRSFSHFLSSTSHHFSVRPWWVMLTAHYATFLQACKQTKLLMQEILICRTFLMYLKAVCLHLYLLLTLKQNRIVFWGVVFSYQN